MQFRRLPSQSQDACASCDSSPAGGAKCTCVNPGKVCGKAKPQKSSSYHKVFLCPRACTWLSLRESWREAPERGGSHACGGTNSDRVQWTKQGAVSGAALRFLQALTRARRKNRLSARGAVERSETERATKKRPLKRTLCTFGFLPKRFSPCGAGQ